MVMEVIELETKRIDLPVAASKAHTGYILEKFVPLVNLYQENFFRDVTM